MRGTQELRESVKKLPGQITHQLETAKVLADAGVIRPMRPDRLWEFLRTLQRWGRTPASGAISLAASYPDDPMIVDELGTLSFSEVNVRTNALAHSLSDEGVVEGDSVGIMCRNHRGFVEATVAVSKLGADAVYLNTAFAGPQLTEVTKREKPRALIYDEEFGGLLEEAGARRKRFVAWHDSERCPDPTLDELIRSGDDADVLPPEREGRIVILTSGTTGTPKGASRANPQSLAPAVSLLSRIPLKTRQSSHIAAPLFHSWGLAHFTLGLMLGTTYVLRRRFEPESCLDAVARHRCDALVVVPVMMQRILELPEETRAKYDLSSLKVVAASGSALPGDLATDWMDAIGDTLYNLYGSTEVAWASIATPEDMRAAPGTAGRPPRGTLVKLYDEAGEEVTPGRPGRIFVTNEMLFEGYTGGGSKDVIGAFMATGRRRPLRCGRAPVRRGPRRRDDRVGRRERLPEGDRGHAGASRRGVRGGCARCRRRRLRPAPARFRRARAGTGGERGRPQGARQGEPCPLQGPARDLVPRGAAAQRDRQGAQARAARARRAREGHRTWLETGINPPRRGR